MSKLTPEENFDKEFTGYMQACAKNLEMEVQHLKDFLENKDESYILSNPEEVAYELMNAALTAMHVNGAYNVLDGIRETGIVPKIKFIDSENEEGWPAKNARDAKINLTLINDLRRRVENYKYVDVGAGAECAYAVSRERLNRAVRWLMDSGYCVTMVKLEDGSMAKILSEKPLTQAEIEENRAGWMTVRQDNMNIRMMFSVLGNMERYHLNDFDPCCYREGNPAVVNDSLNKRMELDFCSRLIKAMVRNGATDVEIEGIVKYSMVVLDAEKKHLNWKQAADDFKVAEMREKYYSSPSAAKT